MSLVLFWLHLVMMDVCVYGKVKYKLEKEEGTVSYCLSVCVPVCLGYLFRDFLRNYSSLHAEKKKHIYKKS